MMKMFSLRASEDLLKEVDRLAKVSKVDKSLVLREALEKGFEKVRLETAIKLFSEERLTVSEAANLAGISVGEMMSELRKVGISSGITQEEIEGSLKLALDVIK